MPDPAPDPVLLDPAVMAQADALLKYLQPQQAAPSSGSGVSITGLLGRALAAGGSGQGGMTDDQTSGAGNAALMNFGTSLLGQSGWHQGKTSLGPAVGAALQDAQRGYIGSEAVAAAQRDAQQDATTSSRSKTNSARSARPANCSNCNLL